MGVLISGSGEARRVIVGWFEGMRKRLCRIHVSIMEGLDWRHFTFLRSLIVILRTC